MLAVVSDKAKTIDAILTCAIRVFAKAGFVGSSLRDIAAAAAVPHSIINHYYGSKDELFLAALRRAWEDIDQERTKLFEKVMERHPSEPAPLEELLHSLAYPVVRRALAGDELENGGVALLTQHLPDALRVDGLADRVDRSVERWIVAMAQTCPTLSREDVIWAFSFCVGVIYSWQVTTHRYDSLLGAASHRTVDEITAAIVSFGAAGTQSIVAKRSSAP